MILCFDVGNSDIYGGLMDAGEVVLEFRRTTASRPSSDEMGLFLLQLLQAHGYDPKIVEDAAIASVVPDCNPILKEACRKYLRVDPLILQAGVKTGLRLRVPYPNEVGADRIANAIAAVELFPHRPLVVVDLGTATTFCAVTAEREYLGGVIAAGMQLSMSGLAQRTAKLPQVDVVRPSHCLGRTTVDSIQSGLYFGHLGLLREVIHHLAEEGFSGDTPFVVGTGGLSKLFLEESIFDAHVPDLVFQGLVRAIDLNRNTRTAQWV